MYGLQEPVNSEAHACAMYMDQHEGGVPTGLADSTKHTYNHRLCPLQLCPLQLYNMPAGTRQHTNLP
jgi:hypothetical protein